MQDSSDSNDVLPKAVIYFYPPDEQKKNEKMLSIGEIVGVVQYFQHDLFRSIVGTLNFQKLFVVHQHYGRHSGFLCVPDDRYSVDEAHVYLKHILEIFNLLYGTWNHIQSIYEKNNTITDFFNEALTPIINYILNQHRSITNLFSIIEYTPLKNGNQRVLLDSKHYLGCLKSKYGLTDGFIGHDDKIVYSTCDPDTTFYLQLLCQSKNEISERLISIPWESDFRLPNGISLYRIHLRQPSIPSLRKKATTDISVSATPVPSTPVTATPSIAIPIFNITKDLKHVANDSLPASQNSPHRLSVPTLSISERRSGRIMIIDPSASSEETGFDTDATDEFAPSSMNDVMTTSASSLSEISANELNTEDSDSSSSSERHDNRPITDDDKIQDPKHSRSSTMSEEGPLEKTIKIDRKDSADNLNPRRDSIDGSYTRKNSADELDPRRDSSDDLHTRKNSTDDLGSRFHLIQVDSFDTSDDEGAFQIPDRDRIGISRERSQTITSETNSDGGEHLRTEAQISWKNIPEKNSENEREPFVLYVQRNSRMTFVGIIEQSLLTDEYLNKLWSLMLIEMANIEAETQVIPTANDLIRLTTDVRFEFNENTRLAEFRRQMDGSRYSRRIPSEESTYMAFYARTELNRNFQRKVIGFSRGSHYVSIDRRLPDRLVYSCQRFQETL